MHKGSNILGISIYKVQTKVNTKEQLPSNIDEWIARAKANGINYFMVVANMMTTMYGSVDNASLYTDRVISTGLEFKLQIDGVYGGFYYPF